MVDCMGGILRFCFLDFVCVLILICWILNWMIFIFGSGGCGWREYGFMCDGCWIFSILVMSWLWYCGVGLFCLCLVLMIGLWRF